MSFSDWAKRHDSSVQASPQQPARVQPWSLRQWVAERWEWMREQWGYASIVEHHRRQGAPKPRKAANQEVFIRAHYLERYRDYATERYMRGHDLADSAKLFIEKNLMARTTALDTATTAVVRSIIREMREDEALHPEGLAKYRADMQRGIDEAVAQSKQLYGATGHSPHVTRVLRGRG